MIAFSCRSPRNQRTCSCVHFGGSTPKWRSGMAASMEGNPRCFASTSIAYHQDPLGWSCRWHSSHRHHGTACTSREHFSSVVNWFHTYLVWRIQNIISFLQMYSYLRIHEWHKFGCNNVQKVSVVKYSTSQNNSFFPFQSDFSSETAWEYLNRQMDGYMW